MSHADVELPNLPIEIIYREAQEVGVYIHTPRVWPVLPPDHPWRYSQCERKTAYLHLETAVYKATIRMRQSGIKLKVYCCPFSLHYHVARFRAPTH